MLLKMPRAVAGVQWETSPALFYLMSCPSLRTAGARRQRRFLLLRPVLGMAYGTHCDTRVDQIDIVWQGIQGNACPNDAGAALETEEPLIKSQYPVKAYRFSTARSRTPLHLRPKEEKGVTRLWKKTGYDSPAALLPKVLDGYGKDFAIAAAKQVAGLLSSRQAVILLQMIVRKRELRKRDPNWDILRSLPSGDERRELIGLMANWCYTRDELSHLISIMETRDRLEQIKLFLERDMVKPIFLIKYLLRERGEIPDPKLLKGLIDYVRRHYTGERTFRKGELLPHIHHIERSHCTSLNMSWDEFSHVIKRLAMHCQLVDARFIIILAGVVGQYLQNMSKWDQGSGKTFKNQCQVLNTALEAFRPDVGKLAPNTFQPFPYLWEAQRSLLSLSATFVKPPIVTREGFRSIRETLAGLVKNEAETYSSLRHAPFWPPYLLPADGMDEKMELEESWARSVRAGSMMQEAGYNFHERDHVIDVLQGRDIDGSPTIQQLVTVPPRASASYFKASIMATRNAKEAWALFKKHRKAGMKPDSQEYAALLIKLVQREAPAGSQLRPGDKALNFPVPDEPNLSEFEKARSSAPTIEEVLKQMQSDGVPLDGLCLRLLMDGAPTIDDMHHYLKQSRTPTNQLAALSSKQPDSRLLEAIDLPLFAVYVHRCAREGGEDASHHMARAIHLCRVRFEGGRPQNSSWIPYIWGGILRELGQRHRTLLLTFTEQLELYLTVLNHIEKKARVPVSVVVQLCKNLRKTVSRTLPEMGESRSIPVYVSALYEPWVQDNLTSDEDHGTSMTTVRERGVSDGKPSSPHSLLMAVAKRVSQLLRDMAAAENEQQMILEKHWIDPISRMAARKDISRAPDAYEAMLALALVGEFKEMAWLVSHLAKQWHGLELLEAVQARTFPPPQADFMDTLCAFRLFAEPMLSKKFVGEMKLLVNDSSVLVWPTDAHVEDYFESNSDPTVKKLAIALQKTRNRETTVIRGRSRRRLRQRQEYNKRRWTSM